MGEEREPLCGPNADDRHCERYWELSAEVARLTAEVARLTAELRTAVYASSRTSVEIRSVDESIGTHTQSIELLVRVVAPEGMNPNLVAHAVFCTLDSELDTILVAYATCADELAVAEQIDPNKRAIVNVYLSDNLGG